MKISENVRLYLKNKPYMLEAMENGIVNFSALARLVQKRVGAKSYGAVKASLIRYAEARSAMMGGIEERALSVIKDNRIMLLDKISVLISSKRLEIENDAEVKVDFYYVYLTKAAVFRTLTKEEKYSLVAKHEDCSAIVIYSGSSIEGTSGVVAFMTSLLAEYNVNVIELISCYTETILVVSRHDAVMAYGLLSEAIK